jgi:hypothetical protein
MKIHFDPRSDYPKTVETKENFKTQLRQQFEEQLPEAVERIWELPSILETRQNEPYAALLKESRELFIAGYFYSCVAMCGIVGERFVKDLLRASVLINNRGDVNVPSEDAFNQLERVDMNGIIRFLGKAGVLTEITEKAAQRLGELRNTYAHARGESPKNDARKAIKSLHALIDRPALF